MGDEDAFLRAIAGAPTDDAPRLVYADWLDEHGDAVRAEYVRLLCRDDEPDTVDRLVELAPSLDPAWVARVRGDFPVVHPEYVIRRQVARGVLTTIYEASTTHPSMRGRPVALRILNDRQDPNRFLNSCRLHTVLGEIGHIPPLYHAEFGDQSYAVHMFVEGDDVLNNIRGRVFVPSDLVRTVTTVAMVLDAMHGREIVHGSVHPRHLLQDRDGATWVIGLGEWPPPADAIGNPLHLAPEQLDQFPLTADPRTDVYQLAETAAWLLGGRHPFQDWHRPEELFAAKRSEDGWRTGPFRNLPSRVAAAFRRAMAPDPADRYPSAGEFAAAFADAFEQRPRSRWRFW